MVRLSRFLCFVRLIAGLAGTLLSLAVMFGLLGVYGRIKNSSQHLFDQIDQGVEVAEKRMISITARLVATKTQCDEFAQRLVDWKSQGSRAGEKIQSGLEESSQRVAAGIAQADEWLQLAQSSMEVVDGALNLLNSLGLGGDTDLVAGVSLEISRVRGQLEGAGQAVERFQSQLDVADSSRIEERAEQAEKARLRLSKLLEDAGFTMDGLTSMLPDATQRIEQAEQRTQRWLWVGLWTMLLIMFWIAAGQIALMRVGWKGLHAVQA